MGQAERGDDHSIQFNSAPKWNHNFPVLFQVGVFLDLHFISKPELFVQIFSKPSPFDENGNVVDEKTLERVHKVVDALRSFTNRLQGGLTANK